MTIPWETIALIPALFFAVNSIYTRLGMDASTPQTGNLIVILVNLLGFSLALLWADFSHLTPSVYWLAFLAAGVSSPALSLVFLFRSFQRIGVTATAPISNAHALTGALFAFLLLGERPEPVVWTAIALVAAGIYFISGGSGDNTAGASAGSRLRYIALPLTAAMFFGLAHNLRKIGLQGGDSLLVGGFLQALSAAIATPLLLRLISKGRIYVFHRASVNYFIAAGLAMIGAQFSLLYALSGADVTRVSPMVSTTPLITLVLGWLFLGSRERITLPLIAGTILTVSGVILIALV